MNERLERVGPAVLENGTAPGAAPAPAKPRTRGKMGRNRKGDGSVTEDKKNRRFVVRGPWDKKRRYFKTKEEAVNARKALAAAHALPKPQPEAKPEATPGDLTDLDITFDDWVIRWDLQRQNGNPRTYSGDFAKVNHLRKELRTHSVDGMEQPLKLRDLTRKMCRTLINETFPNPKGYGMTPTACHHQMTTLRKILYAAVDQSVAIQTNPIAKMQVDNYDPNHFDPVLLTLTEWTLLLDAANDYDRAIRKQNDQLGSPLRAGGIVQLPYALAAITLSLYMCIRQGETLGLQWHRVQELQSDEPRLDIRQQLQPHHGLPQADALFRFPERTLEIVPLKYSSGERNHELDQRCVGPLRQLLADHKRVRALLPGWNPAHLVFPFTDGGPMHAAQLMDTYDGLCATAGIARSNAAPRGVDWHSMRHSGLTERADAGMDLLSLKAWAGHANVVTTMRYLKLAGSRHLNKIARESSLKLPSATPRALP